MNLYCRHPNIFKEKYNMCRLLAITSDDFISPVVGIEGLNAMHEGYDGSGVGLLLRDLGGPFKNMKDSPILSGIFSESGLKKLDNYMLDMGFTTVRITDRAPFRSIRKSCILFGKDRPALPDESL